MNKITWFGVAQSPYNDYLLSEVNRQFDLQVYYKIRKKGTHPWQLKPAAYNFRYLQGHFFGAMKRALASDVIVVSGWAYWQHVMLMLLPMKNVKKIYWTDTPNLDRQEWAGIKGFIRRMLVKLCFASFHEVWSTGKPGCRNLEKLGCCREKIRSFPFFLDLDRFPNVTEEQLEKARAMREQNTNHPNEIVFMCMGQLAGKKRFADAINAFAEFRDTNAVLWIAGTGPQEKELQHLTIEMGIISKVFFLGWLQQAEVELAYLASDVFVHPAMFDPFPTVVLDAMTWGKPVIGTSVSGSVEDRVVQGVNGFMFEEGDVESLRRHLQFFIDNPCKIESFSKASRITASEHPVELGIEKLRQQTQRNYNDDVTAFPTGKSTDSQPQNTAS